MTDPATDFDPLPINVKLGDHIQRLGYEYEVDRAWPSGVYRIRRALTPLFDELIEVYPPKYSGNFITRKIGHTIWKHEDSAGDEGLT